MTFDWEKKIQGLWNKNIDIPIGTDCDDFALELINIVI